MLLSENHRISESDIRYQAVFCFNCPMAFFIICLMISDSDIRYPISDIRSVCLDNVRYPILELKNSYSTTYRSQPRRTNQRLETRVNVSTSFNRRAWAWGTHFEDYYQIKAPTSMIVYIFEIDKPFLMEWCEKLPPSAQFWLLRSLYIYPPNCS